MATAQQVGHLSYQEFQQALHLFVGWWQQTDGGLPCWNVTSFVMPVTDQVVEFAVLERVMPAACGAAAEADTAVAATPAPAAAGGSATAAPDTAAACTSVFAADAGDSAASTADAAAAEAECAGDDEAALCQPAAAVQGLHVHQYSIVYHDTYRVPVLYIKAFTPDGVGLSLPDLLLDLPGLQQHKEPRQADWTFITAVEHPLLRSQCFMLHPCQTATRMQLMMQEAVDSTAADAAGLIHQGAEQLCAECSLLLVYMTAWFSIVAGLLGISMLALCDAATSN